MKGLGRGFDDQAGFVNRLRSDVVNAHAFNRLTLYGARGAALENLTVFFGPDRTWLYREFGFNAALEGFDVPVVLKRGMSATISAWCTSGGTGSPSTSPTISVR